MAIGRLAGVSFEARDGGAEVAGHGQGAEVLGQLLQLLDPLAAVAAGGAGLAVFAGEQAAGQVAI